MPGYAYGTESACEPSVTFPRERYTCARAHLVVIVLFFVFVFFFVVFIFFLVVLFVAVVVVVDDDDAVVAAAIVFANKTGLVSRVLRNVSELESSC